MNKLESIEKTLVIASGNAGKIKEFRQFLVNFPLNIINQPKELNIYETGKTFAENARLKAIETSNFTGEWCLADDSGLCVDSLSGRPGVHSSRYAKNDSERIRKLLFELNETEDRRAHFIAALCIAAPANQVLIEVEGRCEGVITRTPRGEKGFGYDPVFEVLKTGRTYAEMELNEKKEFGHRGLAFSLLEPKLFSLLNRPTQNNL